MALTKNQIKFLRGITHGLRPTVLIGGNGLTPAVIAELLSTLETHELVKVKMNEGDREERAEMIEVMLELPGVEMVQKIGSTLVVYKEREEDPELKSELPRK